METTLSKVITTYDNILRLLKSIKQNCNNELTTTRYDEIFSQGAFGDKLGNNLAPVKIFLNMNYIFNALQAYERASDKPAYDGEPIMTAMHRTLDDMQTAINETQFTSPEAKENAISQCDTIRTYLDEFADLMQTLKQQSPDSPSLGR